MFKILTTDGVFLDLNEDWETEIEIENPIFSTDSVPVAFSTSVLLPPTETNIVRLKYVAAQKQAPEVLELEVLLQVDGFRLAEGKLQFDGITEDGDLEYIFTSRSLDEEWGKKLYELPSVSDAQGREFPIIIKSNATGYCVFDTSISGRVQPNIKYYNVGTSGNRDRIPALPVDVLLRGIPRFVYKGEFDGIYILGTYREEIGQADINTNTLPDASVLDLVRNLAKIYCLFIFQDGRDYVMKGIDTLLNGTPEDWSTKISDEFESGLEKAQGYKFGYAGDESETDETDPAEFIEESADIESLFTRIQGATIGTDYQKVLITSMGYIYSCKKSSDGSNLDMLFDILTRKGHSIQSVTGEDQFDNSTEIQLVKCAPTRVDWGYADEGVTFAIAPIIDVITPGTKRPTEIIIGEMHDHQLIDGPAFGNIDDGWFDYDAPSIRTQVLTSYHSAFMAWLAKDRQTISAELNLKAYEINAFRFWKPVLFANKAWIVRKLSVTLSAKAGITSVNGEFVAR